MMDTYLYPELSFIPYGTKEEILEKFKEFLDKVDLEKGHLSNGISYFVTLVKDAKLRIKERESEVYMLGLRIENSKRTLEDLPGEIEALEERKARYIKEIEELEKNVAANASETPENAGTN